jgi:hypothetical protein
MTQQYNRCCLCSEVVEFGRPAFAGYSDTGEPIVVCAECADALKEFATPVYWSGSFDLSVDENQALWRYMDFSKFVAMMQQNGIYFTRASKFDDPFEAAAGIASREGVWNEHYLQFFRQAVTTPPPGYPPTSKTASDVEKEAARLLGDMRSAYAQARDLLVCCWHSNSVESEALWRIYCSPGAPGIAVKTRVGRLWNALKDEAGANVGKVQYIDFSKSFSSGDQRIYCKRSSLAHESRTRKAFNNIDTLQGAW